MHREVQSENVKGRNHRQTQLYIEALTDHMVNWQGLTDRIMNLRFPEKVGEFLVEKLPPAQRDCIDRVSSQK
jgi:hypothetical protein